MKTGIWFQCYAPEECCQKQHLWKESDTCQIREEFNVFVKLNCFQIWGRYENTEEQGHSFQNVFSLFNYMYMYIFLLWCSLYNILWKSIYMNWKETINMHSVLEERCSWAAAAAHLGRCWIDRHKLNVPALC